jgi:hypothetical protein
VAGVLGTAATWVASTGNRAAVSGFVLWERERKRESRPRAWSGPARCRPVLGGGGGVGWGWGGAGALCCTLPRAILNPKRKELTVDPG